MTIAIALQQSLSLKTDESWWIHANASLPERMGEGGSWVVCGAMHSRFLRSFLGLKGKG